MEWSPKAQEIFNTIIKELPQFHRAIAERLVKESSETAAFQAGKQCVEERDVIDAFGREVPPAFQGMMKRLFQKLNIEIHTDTHDADAHK